jgi:hypothetical protein
VFAGRRITRFVNARKPETPPRLPLSQHGANTNVGSSLCSPVGCAAMSSTAFITSNADKVRLVRHPLLHMRGLAPLTAPQVAS